MNPGDPVTVTIGGRSHKGTVLYVRDGTARVDVPGRKPITRPLARVKPVAGPKVPSPLREAGARVFAELHEATPHPALRPVPKAPKPWRSEAYRSFVREQPCCCCGGSGSNLDPIVAHHHGPHAMSEKGDDTTCVPLLDSCHKYFHQHGVFAGEPGQTWTRDATDRYAATVAAKLVREWCCRQGLDTDIVIVKALTALLRESA